MKLYFDPCTVNCRKVLAGLTSPEEVIHVTMSDLD